MIIGTAGHIDHGKTTLVRALTGVDTDRLPEEKKRGITIELGFAPLVLDAVGTVGVVDVPGHEAFVHTMLAGAGGIDVGLLVIAANDGVQPQTREHLTILKLLGVRAGVVALTKCDLAEPAWMDLVEEDVRALVADTPFAGAPIVRVAPGDAAALDAVRAALAVALRMAPPRNPDELFRLPVDRVFTVRGTGTVVTGTSWSGVVRANDEARVLPSGKRTRVRGVQIHNAETDAAAPGSRTAVALVGLSTDDVHRGDVLVTDGRWIPILVLRADLQLLADAPRALGPRTKVRFHLGTAEVGARAIAVGGALQPGETRPVRLVLDAPVVARAGDRFVLRASSPAMTVGGGVITDAMATRRSKPFARVGMSASERLTQMLREAGARGVSVASLGVRLVSRLAEVEPAVRESGAQMVGDLAIEPAALAAANTRLLEALDRYHAEHPLAAAAPLSEIREQLRVGADLATLVVEEAQRAGAIEVEAAGVRKAGWKPNLADRDSAQLSALVQRLEDAGGEPPTVAELGQEFGKSVPALLRLAEAQKSVVQVEVNRYYTTANINRIIRLIEAHFPAGSVITPSGIRELLSTSRKYLIPLLEYFDRMGITSRKGDGRVWLGGPLIANGSSAHSIKKSTHESS